MAGRAPNRLSTHRRTGGTERAPGAGDGRPVSAAGSAERGGGLDVRRMKG